MSLIVNLNLNKLCSLIKDIIRNYSLELTINDKFYSIIYPYKKKTKCLIMHLTKVKIPENFENSIYSTTFL